TRAARRCEVARAPKVRARPARGARMQDTIVKRLVPAMTVALIVGFVAARHVMTAERRGAAPQAGAAVRTLPPGSQAAGGPHKKGDTYYWIESQIVRSRTKLGETVVETDRRADGKLHAKVVDRAGNEHGDFTASSTLVQFRHEAGSVVQAQNDSGEPAT